MVSSAHAEENVDDSMNTCILQTNFLQSAIDKFVSEALWTFPAVWSPRHKYLVLDMRSFRTFSGQLEHM
jgi:hypothetical protein